MSATMTAPRLLRDAPIVDQVRRRGRGWLTAVAREAGLTRNGLHGLSTTPWSAEDEQRIVDAYARVCATTDALREGVRR